MTLLEACEPLFQLVCRLSRSARKGATFDPGVVRNQILGELAEARARCASDGTLASQFDKIELALIYFVDFMIKESDLSFAREWKELAHERNKLAGDEEFFDLLDETLADPSKESIERLEVYYTCLGLGFTGFYTGQHDELRKKMGEIRARIRSRIDTNLESKICDEAYAHTNTSDLIQPPGRSLVGIGIALVALLVLLFVANVYLYRSAAGDLGRSLGEIAESAPTATPTGGAE